MNEKSNGALSRLSKIDWSELKTPLAIEHVELLRQYFQRASKFLDRFGPSGTPAFFDATEIICGELVSVSPIMQEQLNLIGSMTNSLSSAICLWYLKWIDFRGEYPDSVVDFEDLYEPLIILLEKGVCFSGIRKGELFLGIDGHAFPLANWRTP